MGAQKWMKVLYKIIQSYHATPKVLTVKSYPMGILRLIVVTSTMSFLIYAQLISTKGYQRHEVAESSVVTKVKGRSM